MKTMQLRAIVLKRLCALLLALPLLTGCEQALDDLYPKAQAVQLPAETHGGANTFGCFVNGQLWEANNTKTLTGTVLTPKSYFRHGELRLNAFRRLQVAGPVNTIALAAVHVTGPGVYRLGPAASATTGAAWLQTANGRVGYGTDAEHVGTLIITRLDTAGAHPFVAGRFELQAGRRPGDATPADFPAELRITEGRFDIQLGR